MRLRLDRQFNRDSINRLYVVRGRFYPGWFFSLQWGNRNSDPVWSIGIECHAG